MITVNKEFIAVPMSFSGGEVQADTKALMSILDDEYNGNTDDILITANIKDSDDIFALLQIKEAIDNLLINRPEINVHLKMPYLPYARYDRRMHLTDSFSLKVFTNILNSAKFDSVTIDDCHSDVGVSLIDKVIHREQKDLFSDFYHRKMYTANGRHVALEKIDAIIAPDMGAVKKAGKIADELKVPLIVANKVRDLATGKILKYEILNATNIPDNVFIVDDICDGGATFLLLAEELKNLNKNVHISLYVTHGIFSKGLDVILDKIDKVYAYHLWSDAGDHSKVNQEKYKNRYFWINYF